MTDKQNLSTEEKQLLAQYDAWLEDGGPAALVIREYLVPVEGKDGVLFPPTFAAAENKNVFAGGYNIDGELNGDNVCLIDSVGSQANRIEPLFAEETYSSLIPQIVVKAGEKSVNILEAGHRAGDAIFRCCPLQDEIEHAFKASVKGDVLPLAKIAPTSLVFGVWNSRGQKGNQDKRPRLIASAIRAFNVRRMTRGAVYIPPLDYSELDVFSDEDKAKAEDNNKSPLAQRGFVHNPVPPAHGGVIATGGIRRDATLGLAALRLLKAGNDKEKTRILQRYLLGLTLTAFTHNPSGYLRQGCILVLDLEKPREFVEVYPSGERKPATITHDIALEYAKAVAKKFGVGESRTVDFDKDRAKKDVAGEGDTKKQGKKGKKAAEAEAK